VKNHLLRHAFPGSFSPGNRIPGCYEADGRSDQKKKKVFAPNHGAAKVNKIDPNYLIN
jgi:hypothetical protein